jgi:UDP-N-acetylglucosamine 4,6-dehydratase/5-epimerase
MRSEHGGNGDIFVQKAPAATIDVLAKAILGVAGRPGHEIKVIGTRHGEKLYEVLLSREEMACAEDRGEYFRVPPDLRDLNYSKFVEEGEARISLSEDYNSHNTRRLGVPEMSDMLLRLPFMRAFVDGRVPEAVD